MSVSLATLLGLTLAATMLAFGVLWLISGATRNAGHVDVYWGPGFAVTAWLTVWLSGVESDRALLLATLTTLWAVRLGWHLGKRNLIEHTAEDKRYAEMRAVRPEHFFWWSLPWVFMLQAGIQWIVSLPVQAGAALSEGTPLGWFDLIGVIIFATGLTFETIADRQLDRFKADPANKGKVLDTGLWAWSRHPNYFGDAAVWWGLFVIALGSPFTWWTVVGPVVMTFFLMRVSGVPLLEKGMMDTRPEYRAYRERTSAFFPWPPRRPDDGT